MVIRLRRMKEALPDPTAGNPHRHPVLALIMALRTGIRSLLPLHLKGAAAERRASGKVMNADRSKRSTKVMIIAYAIVSSILYCTVAWIEFTVTYAG